jgi:arsenite transporter
MLFGLSSGAALAAAVGVLVEVPTMLLLVEVCKRTKHMFPSQVAADGLAASREVAPVRVSAE